MTTPRATRCTFIPPWLVERVDGPERAARDDELRRERALRGRAPRPAPPSAEGVVAAPDWTVHDAESRTTLPGTPARSAGEPETGDVAVDEAATGIEATLQMFLDDLGARLPRRRRRPGQPDRPLRLALQQRVLGRHPARLR